jgi:hypothetical protein
VLYGWKEGAAHNWYSDRKQTTIIEFNKPLRSEDHPTMKPVDLFYLFNEKIVLSKVILLAIHSLVLAPL